MLLNAKRQIYKITIFCFLFCFSKNLSAVVFNGTYLVGSGQAYTTIQSVITALNAGSVSGPVVFSLIDATYSFANSAAPNGTLNAITGVSSTNTITFKPAAGISPVITITANATQTWGFNLNGSDYIIFDGSNTTGGTTRDMTIIIAGSEGFGFYLKSGATNNIIKNCKIIGKSSSSTNSAVNKGIYFSNDVGNNNNTLTNNKIYKFYDGIWLEGNATKNTSNTINKNKIGSTTSTEYIYRGGIICLNQTICTITQNEVFNIISVDATDGIELDWSTSSTISRNNVHDIVNKWTGSVQIAAGIYSDVSGIANPGLTICNNMISHIAGEGWPSFPAGVKGIHIVSDDATTTGVKIYFNSIYLTADATYGINANNYTVAGVVFDLLTGVDFRNNIIRVSLGERAAYTGTKGYAVAATHCGNTFAIINYNMYYVTGQDNNYVGYSVNGSCVQASNALAAWQTYSGGDANSSWGVAPDFVSTTNLHINTTFVSGTDIAGLTIDFNGNTRGSPPKIGADEMGFCPSPLNGTYLIGEGKEYSDFEDFENAIIKLQTCGVSGPVIFSLTDAAYSIINSSSPLGTITAVTGASATNTITFKPAVGVSPTITITANATQSWGFYLNGADYIIFDGSNITNGTTKNMTINTAGANSNVFQLKGGADHNIIKNCNIKGFSNASTNYGIYAGDFSNNDGFNTIENNTITKVNIGIFMQGKGVSPNCADGNTITQNTVGYYVASPDNSNVNHIISKGIQLSRQTNLEVSKNEVLNIINTASQSLNGISLVQSTNATISRNTIHDVLTTNDVVGAINQGLLVQFDVANPNTVIKNNSIYNIASSGTNGTTVSTSVAGIALTNTSIATTSGVFLYYNTVFLGISNNTAPVGYNYGLYMTGNNNHYSASLAIAPNISGLTMKNNIFRNSLSIRTTATTGGSQVYSFYSVFCESTNPFAGSSIDYNIYYVAGSGANTVFSMGSGSSSNKTFATWKTYIGTQDGNSYEEVPKCTSATNLHISSDCNRGISITGINDDIDGQGRLTPSPATNPDIGADEFNAWTLPVNLLEFHVKCIQKITEINWTTSSEINNNFFTIEKSPDADNFQYLTTITGAGNSNSILNYKCIDENPYSENTYYRLKQTDFDGKETQYNTVVADCSKNTALDNDVKYWKQNNNLFFSLQNNLTDEKSTIKIYDSCGKLIMQNLFSQNQFTCPVSGFSQGLYLVVLSVKNKSFSKKIIIE